jgi:hypothetical protein
LRKYIPLLGIDTFVTIASWRGGLLLRANRGARSRGS